MSAGAGREVVVRLKLVGDESANKSAANNVVREAEKTQKKLSQIDKERTREAEREAKRRETAEQKALREQERAADRAHQRHRERQRSIAAQNRKAREEEARDAERAAKATEAAYVKASNHARIAQMKLTDAIMKGGRAAVQVARGIALMGIASEKDMEKAIRAFARIEAGIQIVSAIVSAVKAGEAAWRAYTAAVVAADIAHKATAASGAMAAAAGAGGSAAGGAARGGLYALGGFIGSRLRGVGSFAGRAAMAGMRAAPGVAAAGFAAHGLYSAGGLLAGNQGTADGLASGYSNFAGMFGQGSAGSLFAPFQSSAYSQRRTDQMLAQRPQALAALDQRNQFQANYMAANELNYGGNGDVSGIMARRGLSGGAADRAEAAARISELGQRRSATFGNLPTGEGDTGEAVAQRRVQFAQEELQLQQQLREAKLTEHRESITAAERSIAAYQKAQGEADKLFQKESDRLKTAEQRLASMDAAEVASLRNSLKTANSGGVLSREQLDLVRSTGLNENVVREQELKRITALGADDLVAQARDQKKAAEINLRDVNVKLATEIAAKVSLEGNEQVLAQQMAEELVPFMENLQKEMRTAIQEAMASQNRQSELSAAQAERAGG